MTDSLRDNNFTKSQIKGVDMCVKATAKKFTFIKGWNLDSKFENFKTLTSRMSCRNNSIIFGCNNECV